MEIKVLEQDFSVFKVEDLNEIDLGNDFTFIGKTDEELFVVCPTILSPSQTLEREDGWKGFRIQGTLDFSLIGILAKITTLLAENGISIFAVSTYNTDYIFVKEEKWDQTLDVLKEAGYQTS